MAIEDQNTEHVTTTEARGARESPMTRHVLSISLILIVVLFAVILFAAG